jgi:hypothetical protein
MAGAPGASDMAIVLREAWVDTCPAYQQVPLPSTD